MSNSVDIKKIFTCSQETRFLGHFWGPQKGVFFDTESKQEQRLLLLMKLYKCLKKYLYNIIDNNTASSYEIVMKWHLKKGQFLGSKKGVKKGHFLVL